MNAANDRAAITERMQKLIALRVAQLPTWPDSQILRRVQRYHLAPALGTFQRAVMAEAERRGLAGGPTEVEYCPECSITNGVTREAAFHAFFATGAEGRMLRERHLVTRPVKRHFVGGGSDPSACAELTCGHVVMT